MMDSERLSRLGDVPVKIAAEIHGPMMRLSEILALRAGSVVSTDSRVGESVDVSAGGARIGDGELSGAADRAVIRMLRFGGRR
jgi:flagellar motor switch/type III secretory pathway protein FliN